MRVLVLVLLSASAAASQPADSSVAHAPRPAWVAVGVSSSAPAVREGNGSDALLTGSLQYQRSVGGRLVLAVGGSSSSAFFSRTELTEAHLAVGASGSAGPLLVTVAGGPSVSRVRPAGRAGGGIAPGLYASAEAVLAVVPAFGIGVHAFGHLNAVMPVVGAGLTLAFGRLPGAALPHPPPTPRRPGP